MRGDARVLVRVHGMNFCTGTGLSAEVTRLLHEMPRGAGICPDYPPIMCKRRFMS